MGNDSKMKKTKHNKKQDGHFKKVNIKHGQQESSRAVFESRHSDNYQ